MELIMQTLFETEWGAIVVGALLFIAFIFYTINKK